MDVIVADGGGGGVGAEGAEGAGGAAENLFGGAELGVAGMRSWAMAASRSFCRDPLSSSASWRCAAARALDSLIKKLFKNSREESRYERYEQ